MAKKSRRKSTPDVVYESPTAFIEQFDCRLSCKVSTVVRSPQYATRYSDDDPLYPAESQLTLRGRIEWEVDDGPTGGFEIVIYGDNAPSAQAQERLKSAQALDKYGSPRWRPYHGRDIPVFDPPSGIGFLDKVSGQQAWSACIWTQSWLVSDMLLVLRWSQPAYGAIRIRKTGRHRWIDSFCLQTTDPRYE